MLVRAIVVHLVEMLVNPQGLVYTYYSSLVFMETRLIKYAAGIINNKVIITFRFYTLLIIKCTKVGGNV